MTKNKTNFIVMHNVKVCRWHLHWDRHLELITMEHQPIEGRLHNCIFMGG